MSVVNFRAYANPRTVPTLVLLDLQQEYVAAPRALALERAPAALERCRAALDLCPRAWLSRRLPALDRQRALLQSQFAFRALD